MLFDEVIAGLHSYVEMFASDHPTAAETSAGNVCDFLPQNTGRSPTKRLTKLIGVFPWSLYLSFRSIVSQKGKDLIIREFTGKVYKCSSDYKGMTNFTYATINGEPARSESFLFSALFDAAARNEVQIPFFARPFPYQDETISFDAHSLHVFRGKQFRAVSNTNKRISLLDFIADSAPVTQGLFAHAPKGYHPGITDSLHHLEAISFYGSDGFLAARIYQIFSFSSFPCGPLPSTHIQQGFAHPRVIGETMDNDAISLLDSMTDKFRVRDPAYERLQTQLEKQFWLPTYAHHDTLHP